MSLFSSRLISKVIITNFAFVPEMNERPPSKRMMGYISGWSCLLDWLMPRVLSWVITQVLRPFMGKFLVVYFDYILICSQSREQHLDHLRQFYSILRREELYANPKKCTFLSTQVQFLRFVGSTDGVFADLEKIRAIEDGPSLRPFVTWGVFTGSLPFIVGSSKD